MVLRIFEVERWHGPVEYFAAPSMKELTVLLSESMKEEARYVESIKLIKEILNGVTLVCECVPDEVKAEEADG